MEEKLIIFMYFFVEWTTEPGGVGFDANSSGLVAMDFLMGCAAPFAALCGTQRLFYFMLPSSQATRRTKPPSAISQRNGNAAIVMRLPVT